MLQMSKRLKQQFKLFFRLVSWSGIDLQRYISKKYARSQILIFREKWIGYPCACPAACWFLRDMFGPFCIKSLWPRGNAALRKVKLSEQV